MSALDWITIEGFKSIELIDRLEIRPINVLIGPNGAGKSNFIGAFSFLNAIRDGNLRNYVMRAGGADKILHFGSSTTQHLTIHISFEAELNQYSIKLAPDDMDGMYPEEEIAYVRINEDYRKSYGKPLDSKKGEAGFSKRKAALARAIGIHLDSRKGEAGISKQRSGRSVVRHVRRHLASWRVFHFHDTSSKSPIKKICDVDDNHYLRPDGSNLAAFLYYLRNRHEDAYDLIQRTVRLAAPFFDDFVLKPQALNEDKIRLEWRHRGSDAYFNASSLSDGSLRFMALATLLLQPASLRPSVILIDEPELGLHPYAITILASLIKQASAETQIVVSTQSSLFLDHFQPEDVLVADRVNGATRITRLDVEKLNVWLEDYSLGQLWEKNEFGGRPARESTRRNPAP